MICHFVEAAEAELEHAFDFYNQRSPELATKYLNDIISGARQIAESPLRWAEIRKGVRKLRTSHFKYGLIYRIVNNRAEIIAVMHPSRKPGYWKNRIR